MAETLGATEGYGTGLPYGGAVGGYGTGTRYRGTVRVYGVLSDSVYPD